MRNDKVIDIESMSISTSTSISLSFLTGSFNYPHHICRVIVRGASQKFTAIDILFVCKISPKILDSKIKAYKIIMYSS